MSDPYPKAGHDRQSRQVLIAEARQIMAIHREQITRQKIAELEIKISARQKGCSSCNKATLTLLLSQLEGLKKSLPSKP